MATLISLCTTIRNRRSQFQATFCDDLDLIARAAASGIKVAKIDCGPNGPIPNTAEEAISACYVEGVTWTAMEKANHVRSNWNIGMGILVANQRATLKSASTGAEP